jgi:A/G-specific adenine glycosylase
VVASFQFSDLYLFVSIQFFMERRKSFISSAIVEWYSVHGRKNLPWRNTQDPYRILIAELMLQKTHAVSQVLPVYTVFIKKFPDVDALSRASVDEIKAVIQSLGLQNTRSRRLKELAGKLSCEFKGKVPCRYADLINLPGVGEYVAGAVECIAIGRATTMADANVGRVLGRVFYGKEEYPPSEDGTGKLARELMPIENCREFNLGIIDLGALICTPKVPKCPVCPLCSVCTYSFIKLKNP